MLGDSSRFLFEKVSLKNEVGHKRFTLIMEKCVQNPAKHPRWSVLRKLLTATQKNTILDVLTEFCNGSTSVVAAKWIRKELKDEILNVCLASVSISWQYKFSRAPLRGVNFNSWLE